MALLRCNSPTLNISANGAQSFSLFLKFVNKCDCLDNDITEAGEEPDAKEYTCIFSVMTSIVFTFVNTARQILPVHYMSAIPHQNFVKV